MVLLLFTSGCAKAPPDDDASSGDVVYGEPGDCEFDDEYPPAVVISSTWDGRNSQPFWYHGVLATFYDGHSPFLYSLVYEEGECRHYQLDYGNCDPPCSGGLQVCTPDDICELYPVGLSAGDIAVTVTDTTTTLTFEEYANVYYGEIPEFDANTPLTLTTTGDEVDGFTYQTSGLDPFINGIGRGVSIAQDQDTIFTWKPTNDPDDCVYLEINSANETHGAPVNDFIECRSPNDGTLVISRALLTTFPLWEELDPYATGHDWPASEIAIYRTEAIEVGGLTFDIEVQSKTVFLVNE